MPLERKLINFLNIFNEFQVIIASLLNLPAIREFKLKPEIIKLFSYLFCAQYLSIILLNVAILVLLNFLTKKKEKRIEP